MTAIEIRDTIAEQMKAQGLSQSELARRIGVEQPNISRYLRWQADSITPLAIKLLDALGLKLVVQTKTISS